MNVYLAEKQQQQLPGDMILNWVLRSDLAPVPRTVEMVVRMKDGIEQKLKEGSAFWTGYEGLKYNVKKIERARPTGTIQGKDVQQALMVTAFLDSCRKVGYVRERGIFKENATLGGLFRACGAEVAIGNDFTVKRFACFAGQIPSFHLAQAMQEECAALVLRENRLSVIRLADFFKQTPKDVAGLVDSSGMIESQYLERQQVPSFFSLDEDGNFVRGDFTNARTVLYQPRTDQRALTNMSRVLVTRKIMDSSLCQQISAGDLLTVANEKLVVITAAHSMKAVGESGEIDSMSRLWLGVLPR